MWGFAAGKEFQYMISDFLFQHLFNSCINIYNINVLFWLPTCQNLCEVLENKDE